MGSPYAFEYRREELRRSSKPCDDSTVAASFAEMVSLGRDGEENGLMLRYLELAQVAVVLGDVMFVHGAVHDFNMG
jgi:hypothetical protein